MERWLLVVLASVLVAAACSDSGGSATEQPGGADRAAPARPDAGACDDADTSSCLLPWPNDRFTRPDEATATGLRVDLPVGGTPTNADGVAVNVSDQNRGDGFSPAAMGMVVIPNLDVEASGLPPVTDIGRSIRDDSPLVVLDVDSGQRVPAWAELDAAGEGPERTPLMIVPATSLIEGHRHVMALRNLVDANGAEIAPSDVWSDRLDRPDALTTEVIDGLSNADLDAADMTIAWSFTVASGQSLSGRLRHMWDETQADIDAEPPKLTVDSSTDSDTTRTVRGSFEVPNYLTGNGGPGESLNNDGDPDGIPKRNGSLTSEFLCMLPTGGAPAPVVLYGHGLLGSRDEALSIGAVGASAGIAFCAIDWIGMSTADVPTVVEVLGELGGFKALPDRLQQGHLAWLVLGHLLAQPASLEGVPAFLAADDSPLIDSKEISFLGASQGGILGGVSSALSSDWTQVILAVPGLGYNLLLPRSIDFDEFAPELEKSYPDPLDRTLGRELIEMLWDRGENAGWAQHLTTDTYDGAPAKNVLLLEAFGDHQVANVSTEKLARTLDVPRRTPTLAEGRSTDEEPFFGIPAINDLPHDGSGLVVWDFGTPAAPTTNVPPRQGDDPHGDLAGEPGALAMVAAFIGVDPQLVDVCDAKPCATPSD